MDQEGTTITIPVELDLLPGSDLLQAMELCAAVLARVLEESKDTGGKTDE